MTFEIFKKMTLSGLALVAMVSSGVAVTLPKYDILDYVPADTAFFYGQFAPKPSGAQLAMVKEMKANFGDEVFKKAIEESNEPEDKFVMSLLGSLMMEMPELGNGGGHDQIRSVAYSVNFMPIYKFEMDDPTRIWSILRKAEQTSGMKADISYRKNVEYWTYSFDLDKETNLKLVVAVHGNWVVLTTEIPARSNVHFDNAFGISKPQKSINQTDILQNIVDKYNMNGHQIVYVDHVKIINTLTGYIRNEFWKKVFADMSKKSVSLACQQDAADIVEMWPRTVWGTTFMESTEHTYLSDTKLIVESKNVSTNEALMGLRGHLPHRDEGLNTLFSMALGLNVDNLTNSVMQLWRAAVNAELKCEQFIEIQAKLRELNPMLLNMATGMARGVYGLGLAVYDLDIVAVEGQDPIVENIDGLVTLSAENPMTQFLSLALLKPELARLKLLEDGTEINVSEFIPDDVDLKGDVKLAINGKHLNMYQGEVAKKVAALTGANDIEANGIFGFSVNYGMLMDLVKIRMVQGKTEIPVELEFLFNLETEFVSKLDFSQNGIEILTQSRMAR